jgi:hypothetical protein
MEVIPKMIDLATKPIEIANVEKVDSFDGPQEPMYPYGLAISLNDETIEKLNMEDDCVVGDHVHFHCLAKVTSCSEHEGSGKRIDLQIIAMSAEDEADESPEEEAAEQKGMSSKKLYGGE